MTLKTSWPDYDLPSTFDRSLPLMCLSIHKPNSLTSSVRWNQDTQSWTDLGQRNLRLHACLHPLIQWSVIETPCWRAPSITAPPRELASHSRPVCPSHCGALSQWMYVGLFRANSYSVNANSSDLSPPTIAQKSSSHSTLTGPDIDSGASTVLT